jgi:beta-phosphoglucomutase-like phosphatase (HAD superfamily)
VAEPYETVADEGIAVVEKALKIKPKDTKKRIAAHKKAIEGAKELHEHIIEAEKSMTERLDGGTQTLQETFGVASSEAGFGEREIVRHLRRAIKRSEAIPRPKGWPESYLKALKAVEAWDPKGESVAELEDAIKHMQAGVKKIAADWAVYVKAQKEFAEMFDKANGDLEELDDEQLKAKLSPYFSRAYDFFIG